MTTIETVKVKKDSPKGYHIINKSDFDPKLHELFTPAPQNDGLTRDEMKAYLASKGVNFANNIKTTDLVELYDKTKAADKPEE